MHAKITRLQLDSVDYNHVYLGAWTYVHIWVHTNERFNNTHKMMEKCLRLVGSAKITYMVYFLNTSEFYIFVFRTCAIDLKLKK